MLMPGRYSEDTASHCAIITQTQMVPTTLNFTPFPAASVSATALGGAQVTYQPGNPVTQVVRIYLNQQPYF